MSIEWTAESAIASVDKLVRDSSVICPAWDWLERYAIRLTDAAHDVIDCADHHQPGMHALDNLRKALSEVPNVD